VNNNLDFQETKVAEGYTLCRLIELLEEISRRSLHCDPVALCVVVRTRGSTPQQAGAAMLVLRDGSTIGTLGGGCVEAEVRIRAQRLFDAPKRQLLQFQLNQDYGWDDGLVCGGVMDIAVQIVASQSDAEFSRKILDDLAADRVGTLAIEAIDEKNETNVFEIEIPPTPRLVIAGAGHVGTSLAAIAAAIDFRVTVIDDRPDYATPARFPRAACIVGDIQTELTRCAIDRQSYVVIVTRGHRHDAEALAAVIRSPAKYLGLIGSKRKICQIFQDLLQQGVTVEQLERVHAPIGFEIGAVTPAEIAVSIAAELIAVRRIGGDSPALPMKMTAEQISRLLRA
jgi:xanthine dehydrogenase accessory factor